MVLSRAHRVILLMRGDDPIRQLTGTGVVSLDRPQAPVSQGRAEPS